MTLRVTTVQEFDQSPNRSEQQPQFVSLTMGGYVEGDRLITAHSVIHHTLSLSCCGFVPLRSMFLFRPTRLSLFLLVFVHMFVSFICSHLASPRLGPHLASPRPSSHTGPVLPRIVIKISLKLIAN